MIVYSEKPMIRVLRKAIPAVFANELLGRDPLDGIDIAAEVEKERWAEDMGKPEAGFSVKTALSERELSEMITAAGMENYVVWPISSGVKFVEIFRKEDVDLMSGMVAADSFRKR